MGVGKQTENLLLDLLKADSAEYGNLETDDYNASQKRQAIRSLMNIRMPGGLSEALLTAQDEYLRQELSEKGIVTLSEIPTVREQFDGRCAAGVLPFADRLSLWQGDITRLQTGAIVNAANSQMLGCFVPCHRCIDNAIHSAAGMQLREECSRIMEEKRMRHGGRYEEPVGGAVLTKAYNLPCNHVIHTVGPIVYGELTDALRADLRRCYESVLACCVENEIRSIAFCCISTGEFHFPGREAAKIATDTVIAFLGAHEGAFDRVIFNVFQDKDREIYEKIFAST